MRHARRSGFSLLEVLLATGILVGSAVALMELASIGSQHAATARDLATSQLICQTKLNEISCGLAPAETVRPTPLEEHPRWVYWVTVLPAEQPGLLEVEVGAAHEPAPRKQKAKFTLVRWIRDAKSTSRESLPPGAPATAAPDALARERDLP
jgi:type II secretory pathway pseudopilin PulG